MSERPLPQADPAPSNLMVIFGAGGDLTARKLIPALYDLERQKLLPERFAIIGVDRLEADSERYRKHLDGHARPFVPHELDAALWKALLQRTHYLQGDFLDDALYGRLAALLEELSQGQDIDANYLFYTATPPRFFAEIARGLGKAGLARETERGWRRLVVEKPFGNDLASARALNRTLHEIFAEHQIFRIDHYLGKETVQNILAYRLANATVEPMWNHRYVDHVQITAAETVGVENRAGYYEHAGALRDMVPNHLLALMSVIAMEPPNSMEGEAVRDEQAKVLRAIQPLEPEEVLVRAVRGQYGPGQTPEGEHLPGYREEPGVDPGSPTETFVAMKLMIDSWRWAGVPFYLRTGKRMRRRFTEIAVQYKHAPNMKFKDSMVKRANIPPNVLVLRIQPDEGIGLSFNAKVPSPVPRLEQVRMDFCYADYFGQAPGGGYETLIYDAMCGDPTLFKRADSIEAGWELVEPVLDVWQALPPRDFPNYAAGGWGPEEADELIQRDGRAWRN
jgi:glucose-6-phosphate 1-dehydrogenase